LFGDKLIKKYKEIMSAKFLISEIMSFGNIFFTIIVRKWFMFFRWYM